MLRWLMLVLVLPLAGGEADPAPLRQGIDRDGFRIAIEIALPALPPGQRDQVVALCVAAIPQIEPGMDLAGHVRTTHAKWVAELAESRKQAGNDAASLRGWYEESTIRTTWSGGGLLSLHGEHHGFTGGAHGWLSHTVLVLDAATLKPLTLDDLIAPGDQQTFADLLTGCWRQAAGLGPEAKPSKHGLFVDELPPALPLITATGLEVIYSPYTVGPWSTGTVRVTLTREQARPFLRRDPWVR